MPRGRLTVIRMLGIALLPIGLYPVGCAQPGPGEAERPPVAAEEYERVLEENAELRERLAELEEREAPAPMAAEPAASGDEEGALERALQRAQNDLADCQAAAVEAVMEADRMRRGVESCVAELNQVQGERRIVISEGAPAAPRRGQVGWRPTPQPPPPSAHRPIRAPEPPRAVRTLSAPRVQMAGEEVLVTARLWNPADVDQHVEVEIALLADGVQKKQETQSLLVPANGDLAVAARFHFYGTFEGKTLSGRVRVLR